MKTEKQLIKEIIKVIDTCIVSHRCTYEHHIKYNSHYPFYAKEAKKWLDLAENWKATFANTLTVEDIKYFRSVFLSDEVILMAIVGTKIFDENKKINLNFIKKNYQHNLAKILKPEYLD